MAVEVRKQAPPALPGVPDIKLLVLDNEKASSLRRILRTRQDQFIETWKKRPLTVPELHDNANLGALRRQLDQNDFH